MLAEKNLTGKFKFEFSEAVKNFSQWLVSIGQDFSYKTILLQQNLNVMKIIIMLRRKHLN